MFWSTYYDSQNYIVAQAPDPNICFGPRNQSQSYVVTQVPETDSQSNVLVQVL